MGQFIFSTTELLEAGGSYYSIRKMVSERKLSRLNKCYYENMHYSGEPNDFFYLKAFVPDGVVCLLTAAVHHGLSTYRPDCIDVAVKNKAKMSSANPAVPIKLHYFSMPRLNLGVQKMELDGNSFLVYDVEKTVVDIVSSRNKVGIEETREILTNYLSRTDRDLNKLCRYADALSCRTTLQNYLDVLL